MKKHGLFLIGILMCSLTGCSIDYTSYYEKYGDVYNKDSSLTSEIIREDVLSYPNSNTSLIEKYGDVYDGEEDNYQIYSSYYSTKYDTLYITYDSVLNPIQTINSRELALIEEHLLNYFISDNARSDYSKYLNVVRVYPDYKSSVCRSNDDEDIYSKIEGCATYDSIGASVNLNGLTTIDRFFKPYSYTEGNTTHILEPKRDTFAHEFGHVSTYYNMILKGDDTYEDYLRIRLGDAFDSIYPTGFPNSYTTGNDYYTQPVEILADDYVELYYDTSNKAPNDYYNYELKYTDLRNSLEDVSGVVHMLKDDTTLYNKVKAFYDTFLTKEYLEYQSPILASVTGNTYNTIHDIEEEKTYVELSDKLLVALGEITINSKSYYRVVLSNVIMSDDVNIRGEYSYNIGYILKENGTEQEGDIVYFTKYNGELMTPRSYLPLTSDINLYAYYDFAYLIKEGNRLKIYNYLDSSFTTLEVQAEAFI